MSLGRAAGIAVLVAGFAGGAGLAHSQALPLFAPLDSSSDIPYRISIDDATVTASGDPQLCRWALDDWARALDGQLRFEEVQAPAAPALVEIHFVGAAGGQYGVMQPSMVNGRRGAAVYIRPDTAALGPVIGAAASEDPLLRDSIVYLTCLHELGHALGLAHTDAFDDIMYFFGYGGDLARYFRRYREQLDARGDIPRTSGLSAGDLERLRALYPKR